MDRIVLLAMAALNERAFADGPPAAQPDAPALPVLAAALPPRRPAEDPVARGIVDSVLRPAER